MVVDRMYSANEFQDVLEERNALKAKVERLQDIRGPANECSTHGKWHPLIASGCPECVRELRVEVERLQDKIDDLELSNRLLREQVPGDFTKA